MKQVLGGCSWCSYEGGCGEWGGGGAYSKETEGDGANEFRKSDRSGRHTVGLKKIVSMQYYGDEVGLRKKE